MLCFSTPHQGEGSISPPSSSSDPVVLYPLPDMKSLDRWSIIFIFTVHADENCLENERNHIQGRRKYLNMILQWSRDFMSALSPKLLSLSFILFMQPNRNRHQERERERERERARSCPLSFSFMILIPLPLLSSPLALFLLPFLVA